MTPHVMHFLVSPYGATGYEINGTVAIRARLICTQGGNLNQIRKDLDTLRKNLATILKCDPMDVNFSTPAGVTPHAEDVPPEELMP